MILILIKEMDLMLHLNLLRRQYQEQYQLNQLMLEVVVVFVEYHYNSIKQLFQDYYKQLSLQLQLFLYQSPLK